MRKSGFTSPPRPTAIAFKDTRELDVALERPFSTPVVRSFGQGALPQTVASSTGKKKRNKLGYHRASIACSKSEYFDTPYVKFCY